MAISVKSRRRFQVISVFSFMALALSIASMSARSARADEVIMPPNGKGWGGGATAESLLNMNRDPEVVRKVEPGQEPIQIKGTCTDDKGRTFNGDDDEYSQCMSRKGAKKKAAAPASVPSSK